MVRMSIASTQKPRTRSRHFERAAKSPEVCSRNRRNGSMPMPRDITRQQLRIVTVVCAFSLSIRQVNAEDQFLVDEGKAYAEIIISESSARSTRLAAAELQTCVAKISGARFPIRVEPSADVSVQIYVGESTHAAKLGVTADRLEHGVYRFASGGKWLASKNTSNWLVRSRSKPLVTPARFLLIPGLPTHTLSAGGRGEARG